MLFVFVFVDYLMLMMLFGPIFLFYLEILYAMPIVICTNKIYYSKEKQCRHR